MGFRELFNQRKREVQGQRPDLKISMKIGKVSEFPKKRNYAYCAWDGDKIKIVFAPKIRNASRSRQDALIRHELAHGILQSADLTHTERECDGVAEEFWGDPIYYDSDDVQTLSRGTRPRPRHLPNPGGER